MRDPFVSVRIDVEEEAIRHSLQKHIHVTNEEIEVMVKAQVDRMDLKTELEREVARAVQVQLQSMLFDPAMKIARREAARVVGELTKQIEEARP